MRNWLRRCWLRLTGRKPRPAAADLADSGLIGQLVKGRDGTWRWEQVR
jgi:hypothetical protein